MKAYYWYGTETRLRRASSNTPIAITTGDVTGDTKDNLLIGETGSIYLYDSATETWITIATGLGDSRISLAIGDVNGDQHNDIVAVEPNNLWVIQSEGDSIFQSPVPLGHNPQGATGNLLVAVADLNMDNLADIITADQDRTTIHISNPEFFQKPTSTYQPEPLHLTTPGNPQDLTVGNIAGDPNPDLATVRRNPHTLQIYQSHTKDNQQGLCLAYNVPFANGTAVSTPKDPPHTLSITTDTAPQSLTFSTGITCQTAHQPLPTLGALTEPTEPTEGSNLRDPTHYNEVAAGYGYACGLRMNGAIRCWGDNDKGQSSPPNGIFNKVALGDETRLWYQRRWWFDMLGCEPVWSNRRANRNFHGCSCRRQNILWYPNGWDHKLLGGTRFSATNTAIWYLYSLGNRRRGFVCLRDTHRQQRHLLGR